ncbi:MAG: TVP38/TMEM64 family protein [Acidimicrobiales bacterium]
MRPFTDRTLQLRLLVVVTIVAAAIVFVVAGGVDFVTDGDRVEEFFTESGAVGPIVFVLMMWALQPWGVPGAVFMVPASLIWPWPVAMGLSWLGNMGASSIAFGFARFVAREWVQKRIPPSIAQYDERLAHGGLKEVTLLRVATGQLPPADWLLGVSQVRWPPFLIGTAIGIIPGIILIVTVGGSLFSALADRPGLLIGLTVLTVVFIRRRRAAVNRSAPAEPTDLDD